MNGPLGEGEGKDVTVEEAAQGEAIALALDHATLRGHPEVPLRVDGEAVDAIVEEAARLVEAHEDSIGSQENEARIEGPDEEPLLGARERAQVVRGQGGAQGREVHGRIPGEACRCADEPARRSAVERLHPRVARPHANEGLAVPTVTAASPGPDGEVRPHHGDHAKVPYREVSGGTGPGIPPTPPIAVGLEPSARGGVEGGAVHGEVPHEAVARKALGLPRSEAHEPGPGGRDVERPLEAHDARRAADARVLDERAVGLLDEETMCGPDEERAFVESERLDAVAACQRSITGEGRHRVAADDASVRAHPERVALDQQGTHRPVRESLARREDPRTLPVDAHEPPGGSRPDDVPIGGERPYVGRARQEREHPQGGDHRPLAADGVDMSSREITGLPAGGASTGKRCTRVPPLPATS